MQVTHDIHVHTKLSRCCQDPEAIPANYIRRAAELGLKVLGFADHLWDESVPGASEWYQPQDVNHLLSIKEMLPEGTGAVRVLIGCESEYCGDGKVGISHATAEKLDFVLLPMSHFHMKGFVVPPWLSRPADVGRLLIKRFQEVLELELATGIAHPFLPLGFMDQADAILATISDAAYTDCFGRAAELGVSIEIHKSFFSPPTDTFNLHAESVLRMLTIAKQCGCCFHFASDAHSLSSLETVLTIAQHLEQLRIGEDDILPLLR
jgi:histidinol phosphatase-like PHP family hydrolase